MNMMLDGNSAALREYEARQDRLEGQAPTDSELERYIDDWLERKCKKMGEMFLIEALTESDWARIYKAYTADDALELGQSVIKTVRAYWETSALEDANEHNFEEDRRG